MPSARMRQYIAAASVIPGRLSILNLLHVLHASSVRFIQHKERLLTAEETLVSVYAGDKLKDWSLSRELDTV